VFAFGNVAFGLVPFLQQQALARIYTPNFLSTDRACSLLCNCLSYAMPYTFIFQPLHFVEANGLIGLGLL
jgi:hypothetical protein